MRSNFVRNMMIVALIFTTTILSVLGYAIYAALTVSFFVVIGVLIVKKPILVLQVAFIAIVISAIAPNYIK